MTQELLAILRARANKRGVSLASEAQLLDALRCEARDLKPALEALENRREIRILSPLIFSRWMR